MMYEDGIFLKNIAVLSFCTVLKGNFILKNFPASQGFLHLIEVFQSLGVEIEKEGNAIKINSNGAFHLFEPEKQIDLKSFPLLAFPLCGIFAAYDYNIFFTGNSDFNFSSLILGLYDAGIRFSYSKNFTLPFSMKGNSNFLPMTHEVLTENRFLELTFLLLGMQGIGKTKVISKFENNPFLEIIKQFQIQPETKILEDGKVEIKTCLQEQEIEQNLTIFYERI